MTIPGLAEATPEVAESLRAKADGAMIVLMSGECATTPTAFEPVVSDSGFGSFDDETRAALLGGAAMCAMSGGDVKSAYRYARQGADEPAADGANWTVRFTLALANEDSTDAVRSFHVLASRFPKALAEIDDGLVLAAYQSLTNAPNPEARRLQFLDALRRSGWTPQDPFDAGAGLRLERVRLLLGADRAAEARTEAAALDAPMDLLALRVDDRFAPARSGPARDLRQAARDALKRVTVATGTSGDRLSASIALAEIHLMLDEPDTALRVIDAALERSRKGGAAAYVDGDRNLNWARDLRAQALLALGRWNEGLEAMAEAAGTPEDGADNFSQLVNLAGVLTFLGRPAEALATLDAVNDSLLTDDGRGWVEAARACAKAEAADAAGARRALALVDSLGPKNWAARVHGRLCLDDLDGAAALYAERLAQPEHRLDALLALQDYRYDARTESTAPTPWGAKRRRQLAALKVRADVRAAVAKAGGRIERVELADVHGRL